MTPTTVTFLEIAATPRFLKHYICTFSLHACLHVGEVICVWRHTGMNSHTHIQYVIMGHSLAQLVWNNTSPCSETGVLSVRGTPLLSAKDQGWEQRAEAVRQNAARGQAALWHLVFNETYFILQRHFEDFILFRTVTRWTGQLKHDLKIVSKLVLSENDL